MAQYPKINYIGNKNKLAEWIIANMPVNQGTVLDVFSGGCSVSYALKRAGYTVYSNDILYSNYVIAKAIIENIEETLLLSDIEMDISKDDITKKTKQLEFLSNKLYFDYEIPELAKLTIIADSLQSYKKDLFLSLLRRAMIRKLPYSRMNVPWNQIVKLRDEDYSYEKYGRKRAYHNQSFLSHIEENLQGYNSAVFDNGKINKAYNYDAFKMLEKLEENVDIIYLDPPYPSTMNKYDEFYGLYDEIFEKKYCYVNFSEKGKFLEILENLIKNAIKKCNFIVLSQNNKARPGIDEISEMMSKYGKILIKEKTHQYKLTGKANKNESTEALIILEVKKA